MKKIDYTKVLTSGAGGMIGSYIDFGIRTDAKSLDILDGTAVQRFVQKHNPHTIIHLAGATDMGRCESDPQYAIDLNVIGTYNIASAAQDVGATFVYVSSSRVFSGEKKGPYTEQDVPDPQSNYGRSKYMGELVVASVASKHIIVRTCWVFGGGPARDNKFYGNVLRQLSGSRIRALDDVHGSPTYGKDLVTAIKRLLEAQKFGVFHISNSGATTRAGISQHISRRLKPGVRVESVQRSHFQSSTNIPTNEAIISESIYLRPWREALDEYLSEEWEPYLRSERIIV